MDSTTRHRRGFLRGLVSLPLIGGSVTLLGQPTGAAVPVTADLMDRYCAWLARELGGALVERDMLRYPARPEIIAARREWVQHMPVFRYPDDPIADAAVQAARPSTRAAVVLGAVGAAPIESQ